MTTATAAALLTAEEYGQLPDNGQPTELVRGTIVSLNMPYPRHGQICGKIACIVGAFVDAHGLGHLLTNDAGVITARGPDTVRGPDLSFYSFARLPRGPLPPRYLDVVPELVFEVRSPGDRWARILAKVAEFLDSGVQVACVLDDITSSARLFYPDEGVRIVGADEELSFPEQLGDFRTPLRRFFE